MAHEDFGSAALRHARDSEQLFDINHFDNAAYLAGYAVECSCKVLIECTDRLSPKALGHDLTNLAGRALSFARLLSPGMPRYRPDDVDVDFTFQRWTPEMRYEATGEVTQGEAQRLVRAAQVCLDRIVFPLVLDGKLEVPQ